MINKKGMENYIGKTELFTMDNLKIIKELEMVFIFGKMVIYIMEIYFREKCMEMDT